MVMFRPQRPRCNERANGSSAIKATKSALCNRVGAGEDMWGVNYVGNNSESSLKKKSETDIQTCPLLCNAAKLFLPVIEDRESNYGAE